MSQKDSAPETSTTPEDIPQSSTPKAKRKRISAGINMKWKNTQVISKYLNLYMSCAQIRKIFKKIQ